MANIIWQSGHEGRWPGVQLKLRNFGILVESRTRQSVTVWEEQNVQACGHETTCPDQNARHCKLAIHFYFQSQHQRVSRARASAPREGMRWWSTRTTCDVLTLAAS